MIRSRLIKFLPFVVFVVLFVSAVEGKERQLLSPRQMERLKDCQRILQDVEKRPLLRLASDLEKSVYPEGSLQIMEAMAATYEEIAREQKIERQKDKERLYSLVELNMAYFQLGGLHAGTSSDPVYRLIGYKLKKHLPPELLTNSKLFHSLE